MDQAQQNAGAYSPQNLGRMRNGRAPIGIDGFPMERCITSSRFLKAGPQQPGALRCWEVAEHAYACSLPPPHLSGAKAAYPRVLAGRT